jgi:hypothetical protein
LVLLSLKPHEGANNILIARKQIKKLC